MQQSRRNYLRAMGAGGTAAVAGCLSAPQDATKAGTRTISEQQQAVNAADTQLSDRVAADPTDIPGPITRNEPTEVDLTLTTKEVTAEIEDGVTFNYMTFDGHIPGPLIRVRQGDTVNLTFENAAGNMLPHNVDFHAVAGPGGGAEATMTAPGETSQLRFKATYPGAFIYHCAVPNLDMHISAGMFGMILVEPPEGLPEVDRELYFGQHEVYAREPDDSGHSTFDMNAMIREDPTYVLINGEQYAITDARRGPATIKTDETVRVFFAVGGPNLTSSFHPIGSVWEEFWPQGAITSEPQQYVQTSSVPPGSTAVATLNTPVPGPVKLVDHSLSRVAKKGCMAVLNAEGEARPDIFDPEPGE